MGIEEIEVAIIVEIREDSRMRLLGDLLVEPIVSDPGDGTMVWVALRWARQLADHASPVAIEFDTEAGRSYRVEYTESSAPGLWKRLSTVPGTGTPAAAVDQREAGEANRFYRVIRE